MPKAKSGAADRHVYCFVPSDEIEVVVLAAYLQSFVDGSATIKPSRHPREALEDLIQDSKLWEKDQSSREFQGRPYDYQDSDTWARRTRLGASAARISRAVEGRRSPSPKPADMGDDRNEEPGDSSILRLRPRLKVVFGITRNQRTVDESWVPAGVRFQPPGLGMVASLMAGNAVTVSGQKIMIDEGGPVPWAMSNASVWPNNTCHLLRIKERLPPEAYLLGYAAFGILLVYTSRSTPQHNYQDAVYYGSVVLGVLAIILDVLWGTALPSSLCRVMPMALLCGQLISMLVGKASGSEKALDSQQPEKNAAEAEM